MNASALCPLCRKRYEDCINRLIPAAEQAALARVKALGKTFELRPAARPGGKETFQHDFFSEFFHEEMNRLAAKEGLRRL